MPAAFLPQKSLASITCAPIAIMWIFSAILIYLLLQNFFTGFGNMQIQYSLIEQQKPTKQVCSEPPGSRLSKLSLIILSEQCRLFWTGPHFRTPVLFGVKSGDFSLFKHAPRTPFQIEAEFSFSVFYVVALHCKSACTLWLLHLTLEDFCTDSDILPLSSTCEKMTHIRHCHMDSQNEKTIV